MPVKRRFAKRRVSEAAQIDAWGEYFGFGYEGFAGDLEGIGVTDPAVEVEAAWHRLGALWLPQFLPRPRCGQWVPWALEKFGPPKGKTDAG